MTFACAPYRFTVDDGFAVLELGEAPCELAVDDLDRLILAENALPQLDGAPVASWLLARLAHLSQGLGLQPDAVECIEGGVWVLDFVVHSGGLPVAKVQLQGGMIGAGLLGVAVNVAHAEAVMQALLQTLLKDPEAVSVCGVRIRDPGWQEAPEDYRPVPNTESLSVFGFDGARYLGAQNPRPL